MRQISLGIASASIVVITDFRPVWRGRSTDSPGELCGKTTGVIDGCDEAFRSSFPVFGTGVSIEAALQRVGTAGKAGGSHGEGRALQPMQIGSRRVGPLLQDPAPDGLSLGDEQVQDLARKMRVASGLPQKHGRIERGWIRRHQARLASDRDVPAQHGPCP